MPLYLALGYFYASPNLPSVYCLQYIYNTFRQKQTVLVDLELSSEGVCYSDMSFELTLRELYRIHWYDVVFFLLGALLSFADPVTDILTLVVFYNEGHKIWFGVGLAFVILPCFVFPFVHYFSTLSAARRDKNDPVILTFQPRDALRALVFGFNPFSAALVRLRAFYLCMKHFRTVWSQSHVKTKVVPRPSVATAESDGVLLYNKLAPLVEALLESCPQAIIQLYAINVQEEPVNIIQMISLPVSFLTLAWTFTTADGVLHDDEIGVLDVRNQVLLFVTNMFLLTSRLFAVAYFIVSYHWWIISILMFRCTVMAVIDVLLLSHQGRNVTAEIVTVLVFLSLLNWVRDDMTIYLYFDEGQDDKNRKQGKRMQVLSNVLFAAENLVMISLFYFHSQHANTWYALPVTIGVCLSSYVGVLLRLVHFKLLRKAYEPIDLEESPGEELITSPTISVPPITFAD